MAAAPRRAGPGHWVMVLKNEQEVRDGGKNLRLTTAPADFSKPWSPVSQPVIGPGSPVRGAEMAEGPALVKWQGQWFLSLGRLRQRALLPGDLRRPQELDRPDGGIADAAASAARHRVCRTPPGGGLVAGCRGGEKSLENAREHSASAGLQRPASPIRFFRHEWCEIPQSRQLQGGHNRARPAGEPRRKRRWASKMHLPFPGQMVRPAADPLPADNRLARECDCWAKFQPSRVFRCRDRR